MRLRVDVCRAIVLTSLVWMMIDVIILFHFLDTGNNKITSKVAIKLRGDRRSEDDFRAQSNDFIDREAMEELEILLKRLNFERNGPGEMGNPVIIHPSKQEERNRKFKENQFDVMASDMISINRALPDYRSSKCRKAAQKYDVTSLPKVSIIIVFHNEAWSTLLRTIHSVVNRSPLHLIKEVILIDDLSNRTYLQKPLDLYVKRFSLPFHLIHLPERSGLIRARLHGAKIAKGKVLLFLDAHVEVTEGWLEPLLDRVFTDRKRVVAPIIDVISDENFEYITASDATWGGFNWHLNFRWYPVPMREMERRNHDRSIPLQTPTIAGGLFAIDRQFFYDIGSYDEGMEVWGGENLEISFRVWMCGGSLEIHPCSRVGHVFRKHTPYSFPGGTAKVIHHNSARTAEVWMDEYKEIFYNMVPAAKEVDAGDLTERKILRENLQCKSFRWYLETIYPESPIPIDFLSLGQVKNLGVMKCLDTGGHSVGESPSMFPCHGKGGNQLWTYTGKGEIRSDELCLAFTVKGVSIEKCIGTIPSLKMEFNYEKKTLMLIHRETGLCLQANESGLQLNTCSYIDMIQKWRLGGYKIQD
ncbi:glycosyltransferase, group 2 family protein [Onchocerca flexuosa]|uniref:Polypeptide N-acetylgalactosaminyltransferase n=3 Tax=Onchocerca flexuosa TaxID=387005 RepID=A0A238BP03_9BILA|nr:glycosyltransferase, group 2 family protein [Onchocerca flexuosa]